MVFETKIWVLAVFIATWASLFLDCFSEQETYEYMYKNTYTNVYECTYIQIYWYICMFFVTLQRYLPFQSISTRFILAFSIPLICILSSTRKTLCKVLTECVPSCSALVKLKWHCWLNMAHSENKDSELKCPHFKAITPAVRCINSRWCLGEKKGKKCLGSFRLRVPLGHKRVTWNNSNCLQFFNV